MSRDVLELATSLGYLDELYRQYQEQPGDIDASWHDVGVATASTYYVDAIHQSAAGQTRMARLAHDLVLDTLARMRPAG